MHNLENLPLDLSALNQPVTLAYIAASILFILACSGLSRHESAVKGNIAGMVGMAFACAAAASSLPLCSSPWRSVLVVRSESIGRSMLR